MHRPTEISNPTTGERIVFDEDASSDERLVWEEFRPADVDPPPVHLHPETEERFVVTAGTLVVDLAGERHRLGPGDRLVVPPGTPHVSYTVDDAATFSREVAPAGDWRAILTDRFAAAHALGPRPGLRGALQAVLLARAYPDVVVLARPPRVVQRALFPVLAGVGRLVGLTAHYPYPTDCDEDSDGDADSDGNGGSDSHGDDDARRSDYKRTVERYPRAVAAGEFDVIEELCTADVVSHTPLDDPEGVEALKAYERPVHEAFPDFDVTVEDVVAEDDRVAMRLTIRGTHEGPFLGVDPTGRTVEFQNVVFHRMEEGRIAERWVQPDVFGLREQLDPSDETPA